MSVSRVTQDLARRLLRRFPMEPPAPAIPPEPPEPPEPEPEKPPGETPAAEAPSEQPSPAADFGFPGLRGAPRRPQLFADSLRPEAAPRPVDPAECAGTCAVTVVTRNYLHFARALAESLQEHHPEIVLFLVVVDLDPTESLEIPGAAVLAGDRIVGQPFDFLALKYTAAEMCCALKPYAIQHLFAAERFARIVYLDSDVCLFARMDTLLAALDAHDFVVTPHILAPLPFPERFWERPTLGDLAFAGTLNAGMFGLRANPRTQAFIETWRDLVTQPGAFLMSLSGQAEQNAFNWISCFADDVLVLRDPAYNAAYWNLHDRSVRWTDLDDGGAAGWTVDGKPLVAFHFSGYSPDVPFAISRYDRRYSLYTLPSLAGLFAHYTEVLLRHGADENRQLAYRYDAFPSGIPVNAEMRLLCKEHETFLWSELSPWTPEGEAYYCRAFLSPVPYTGSLLPILFDRIYQHRPDLQQEYPRARLDPEPLMRWMAAHGIYEHDCREIFDRHRPALPSHHGAVLLGRALAESPQLFAGLDAPLGADRHRFLERLRNAGLCALAEEVRHGAVEHYHFSSVQMVRRIVAERGDVRRAFPDLLFSDAPAFVRWLEAHGVADHFLPPEAPAVFAAKAQGCSLARIYSFLSRNWELMERWPLALVGEGSHDLAPTLLAMLRHGMAYDLEDVVMFLWVMEERPAAGLALTCELPVNACRSPSPLLPEGQEELLGHLLQRDGNFRESLREYRKRHRGDLHRHQEDYIRRFGGSRGHARVSVFQAMARASLHHPAAAAPLAPPAPAPQPGVNFFGYHKSPIGLGHLTRGLSMALTSAGVHVCRNVVGNDAMDADLCPEDFIRTYDYGLDTNLFVSYPHLHEMLLDARPRHVVEGRRNIVHLAWEQRDGSPWWPDVFAGFDQVWALSDFAAESFRRHMRREVLTVPCVLDFASFPPAATKEELGLDPDRFTFLYVFDANSSIERKNPEAAIQAFARAFRPGDRAQLLLRISNGQRLDHKERIKRMLGAAPAGLDIRLVLEPMRHADLLRLISAADCYVSLHRAEGFGYTCAEAMAYGRPVIATGYSGNLQFMSGESSFLVDHGETEVRTADGPFQRGSVWAEPDVEHAAHQMRQVYSHPEEARQVGCRGAHEVRRLLSAEAVGEIVARALR